MLALASRLSDLGITICPGNCQSSEPISFAAS